RYGGDVNISQYNFAGLGATGGVPGNSYPSVQIGIRAQVQHLKAYATTAPLVQACVDDRFTYVTRNTAPYVEWLGIPDNPNGKGWATDTNYGSSILTMISELMSY
nr:glucosaminidase [Lachnospiraceae bacterium]